MIRPDNEICSRCKTVMKEFEPGIWGNAYSEHQFFKCPKCGNEVIVPKHKIDRRC